MCATVSLPLWTSSLQSGGSASSCPEGVGHELEDPRFRPPLAWTGMSDGLLLCFRDGRDRVVQVWLDRQCRRFTDTDIALLRMVAPLLRRCSGSGRPSAAGA